MMHNLFEGIGRAIALMIVGSSIGAIILWEFAKWLWQHLSLSWQ